MNHEILYQKFATGSITVEEMKAFRAYRDGLSPEKLEAFMSGYEQVLEQGRGFEVDSDAAYAAVIKRIREWDSKDGVYLKPVYRGQFLRTAWFRYAAVVLFVIGVGGVVWVTSQRYPSGTGGDDKVRHIEKDILPGGNKAILTLADGAKIVLDSAANGALAEQGSTSILKTDAGSLVYRDGDRHNAQGEVLYNTISTPKGGQYQISLPDGTKVWLNAASSVRFATRFEKERHVEITGEVYFEIAADKNKPFQVAVSGMAINVLGTSFNVNAYANEPYLRTTVLTGSVQVATNDQQAILKPGQQGEVHQNTIDVISNTNTAKAIAWKNGVFNFDGSNMEEVMRQLERWYDITVVYENNVPPIQFVGTVKKTETLASLLTGMEELGVHFRLENGRKLVILP